MAVAEASGAEAGLAALSGLSVPGSHRPAAVRVELLARAGRVAEGRAAYAEAITLCSNETELTYLRQKAEALADSE